MKKVFAVGEYGREWREGGREKGSIIKNDLRMRSIIPLGGCAALSSSYTLFSKARNSFTIHSIGKSPGEMICSLLRFSAPQAL